MNSRWYDPALGRFTQPDTIVPVGVQGTQAYDRFAYVNNNPVRYNDPSGHCIGILLGVDTLICAEAVIVVGIALVALTANPEATANGTCSSR